MQTWQFTPLTFLALNPFFSLWPICNTRHKKIRCRLCDLRNAARVCYKLYPVRHDFPDGSKRRTHLLTRAPAAGVFFCRLCARPLFELGSCAFLIQIANPARPHPHHSSSPGPASRVKPCAKTRTASRLWGLTPAAIPVFWLPCLRRRSLPFASRFPPRTPEQRSIIVGPNPSPRWPLPYRNP
jgi:hypothetical protein